jgi:hypothetical protein
VVIMPGRRASGGRTRTVRRQLEKRRASVLFVADSSSSTVTTRPVGRCTNRRRCCVRGSKSGYSSSAVIGSAIATAPPAPGRQPSVVLMVKSGWTRWRRTSSLVTVRCSSMRTSYRGNNWGNSALPISASNRGSAELPGRPASCVSVAQRCLPPPVPNGRLGRNRLR